jgi:hypothetical protein
MLVERPAIQPKQVARAQHRIAHRARIRASRRHDMAER